MIFWMSFLFPMLIILSKNPYYLIIILLMFTIFIINIITKIMFSQFLSFLILLILVGGLLVMFLYLVSLIPTEAMSISPIMMPMFLLICLMYFLPNQNILSSPSPLSFQNIYYFSSLVTFSIMYLLWTLFSATFITNSKSGPMRMLYEKY